MVEMRWVKASCEDNGMGRLWEPKLRRDTFYKLQYRHATFKRSKHGIVVQMNVDEWTEWKDVKFEEGES